MLKLRLPLLRRNIVANLVGTIFVTALTAVITPIQIRILGLEAFGIVGFIATLQVAFTAFDFGLSSTLTRELAADASTQKSDSNALIDTALSVYWLAAAIIGVGLVALAGPIARNWFNSQSMSPAVIEHSLQVVAIYLALRWPVALYTGLLSGFQKMTALNTLKVSMVSLRLLGGIGVLLVWRTLEGYLVWTSISAFVEVLIFDRVCRRVHPAMARRPVIRPEAISKIWRFSASMNALAIMAVIIVQLDRLFVSKMLPLQMLGFYNLAYTLASGIALLIAAVSTAVLPSMAAAYGMADQQSLVERHRDADRMMLFLVGGAAMVLLTHGHLLLEQWVGKPSADGANGAMALLAIGFWLSGLNANVYNVAIAAGQPGQFLRVNSWLILPYAASLYLLVDNFGLAGAAGAWIGLNLVYCFILIPHVHEHILRASPRQWLARIVLPYVVIGGVAFPGVYLAQRIAGYTSPFAELAGGVASCLVYTALSYYWFFARTRIPALAHRSAI